MTLSFLFTYTLWLPMPLVSIPLPGVFAQFHGGGGADESGQLPVDADSKEGMLVQILMRQSQTLFGSVFLR